MNNTNPISLVKIVATENTTENFNEQMETAQVINDNKTIAMNTVNNQSSIVPQAGACETTPGSGVQEVATVSENEHAITASQVSTITCTEKETEIPVMTPRLPTQVQLRPIYRYRELCKYGFKASYLKGNRPIEAAHALNLAKDADSCADKTFINSAKVVWAREALEAGLELIDEYGNELTLESKDIDSYFVIMDGQHRAFAMHLNSSIDLLVEFLERKGEDLLKIIEKMNILTKDWTGDNYIDALKKKHGCKVPLLEEIDRMSKEFKKSRKYLQALLCNDPNKIRLSKLKEAFSKDDPDLSDYQVDQNKVEFAEKVLTAIQERFGERDKATSTVMFITALLNIKQCLSERDKVYFEENLPAFIISLTLEEAAHIVNLLSIRNYTDLKNYMISRYSTFIQTANIEEVKTTFSELFIATPAQGTKEETSKNAPIRKLKSGTFAQLLQNELDLEEQKKRREKERQEARAAAKEKKKHRKEGKHDEK